MTATRIPRPAWGQFWSNVDQTPTDANQVNTATLNNSDAGNSGITLASGSRVTFAYAGTYNVQFSAQLDRASGSGTDTVDIWPAINGANVADSNTRVTVSGPASQAKTVAAWNWYLTVTAGQYVEIRWSSTDADVVLHHEVAQTGPTRPAIPSIIVTAERVNA